MNYPSYVYKLVVNPSDYIGFRTICLTHSKRLAEDIVKAIADKNFEFLDQYGLAGFIRTIRSYEIFIECVPVLHRKQESKDSRKDKKTIDWIDSIESVDTIESVDIENNLTHTGGHNE